MRGLKAYQQNSLDVVVDSASPYEVTKLLLGGAIKNVHIAIAAQNRGDYIARSEAVSKTQSIVTLLVTTLKDESAEELCQNLRLLYDYVLRALTEFITDSDVDKARSALDCLLSVKSAWDAIDPKKSDEASNG
jgi:flagellar protein FliS